MSAIQLFVGDKMAVVAHLVGPDTIGKTEKNLGLDNDVSLVAKKFTWDSNLSILRTLQSEMIKCSYNFPIPKWQVESKSEFR